MKTLNSSFGCEAKYRNNLKFKQPLFTFYQPTITPGCTTVESPVGQLGSPLYPCMPEHHCVTLDPAVYIRWKATYMSAEALNHVTPTNWRCLPATNPSMLKRHLEKKLFLLLNWKMVYTFLHTIAKRRSICLAELSVWFSQNINGASLHGAFMITIPVSWYSRNTVEQTRKQTNEPCREIMVLFVLRKLILQTRMRSQPVGDICLIFGRILRLLQYFMRANSEESGETARMRRLAWAFTGRLCD